jgi:signal transduction histidine kinase
LRSLVERRAIDALIVVLALAAEVEASVDPAQTPRAVTVPAALLWTLPLLLRRRFPLGAPMAVFAVLTAESLVPGDAVTRSPVSGSVVLATFALVGTHAELRFAVVGAVCGYAALATIILVERPRLADTWPLVATAAVASAIGWALSERSRRTANLEERAKQLERAHAEAVAGERATIARELHDVVAHSIGVMKIQTGAARLLLEEDPARAREALLAVEETGRQALGEMRRLLGILRGNEQEDRLTPQPGISNLNALVEQVRTAGLPVEIMVDGEPRALPPGVDLAAYRVVQEALTNAIKHAPAAQAEVVIRYRDAAVDVAVTDNGQTKPNGRVGHGLIGMRERVALYGGEFYAGPRNEGGFVVRATLPLDPQRR